MNVVAAVNEHGVFEVHLSSTPALFFQYCNNYHVDVIVALDVSWSELERCERRQTMKPPDNTN
jgi:hypothetical protein